MASRTVSKALIPAAGRGTRFLPFTKAVPKELAPLVTTPALELVVAEAAGVGVTDVLLVVNDEKRPAIDAYFGPDPGLEQALERKGDEKALASIKRPEQLARVAYTNQDNPRGLGHAIGCGEEFAAGEPLAVLLPDDIIDDRDALLAPMLEAYAEHGGVVIALLEVGIENISKYGAVVLADGADPDGDVVQVVDMVEKPKAEEAPSTLAVIGRYVLPPEIFDALRRTDPGAGGEIQITDAMQRLAKEGTPVHGVIFRGRRYDTGDRLDYVKAVVQLAVRHPDIGADFRAWLGEYEPEAG
ncbi:UTP--glucose-1-phosphate uridylyltransferase [uncultured Jatrophihabitans sp.]|uniref:UTP--glucose-1-phosphate uridylyltransferase n=1 Tax=uncultured Jatrophihabitans sp. TaxID=1610747 RepID=UPI0035CAC445